MTQIGPKGFYGRKIRIASIESNIVGVVFLDFMLKPKVPVGRVEAGIFVPSKVSAELRQNKKE